MAVSDLSATNLSLLARLRQQPTDQRSWDEFVERYGRRIHLWCRKWGLAEADAQDVTQNVLLALAKQMQTFEYQAGGRFRSWLKTVAYRAWRRYAEGRARAAFNNIADLDRLLQDAAEKDFVTQLEDECNRELLELAIERVKPRIKKTTWEAFRLTTYDQLSAAEAAARLSVSEGVVYVARFRVQKMLLEVVNRLDDLNADESNPTIG